MGHRLLKLRCYTCHALYVIMLSMYVHIAETLEYNRHQAPFDIIEEYKASSGFDSFGSFYQSYCQDGSKARWWREITSTNRAEIMQVVQPFIDRNVKSNHVVRPHASRPVRSGNDVSNGRALQTSVQYDKVLSSQGNASNFVVKYLDAQGKMATLTNDDTSWWTDVPDWFRSNLLVCPLVSYVCRVTSNTVKLLLVVDELMVLPVNVESKDSNGAQMHAGEEFNSVSDVCNLSNDSGCAALASHSSNAPPQTILSTSTGSL